MKPKLIAIFLLIVLLPIGLLVWLGVQLARNEQERVQQRFRKVLSGRLSDINDGIRKLVEQHERELLRVTDLSLHDPETIRATVRGNRLARQIFVLDADGKIVFPPPQGPLTKNEREFHERTRTIWAAGEMFYRPADDSGSARRTHGWYTWFWGNGINFIFWRREQSGRIIGIEVERMALMSDIAGLLPASHQIEPKLPHGRIVLSDSTADTIYQWGAYEPGENESPAAKLSLARPLNPWSLEYFVPPGRFGGKPSGSMIFNVISGVAVAGIMLMTLAVYFYRESSREIREAAQRVSFVNQVSHELKTPLTNIRMYAELLDQQIPEQETKSRNYIDVVVAEGRRLSRLIANVLTFAKKQKNGLRLRTAPGIVDETIASVLDSFRPALEAKDIAIQFRGGAGETVYFDADALEQILGNIFSNVEKYAASGKSMKVSSRRQTDKTVIDVSDKGPGIPEAHRENIFKPFTRLNRRLTDTATGTGIGLSIARDLARLHGGDLALMPTPAGACLKVILHTPRRNNS